jgi:hypothetical protein
MPVEGKPTFLTFLFVFLFLLFISEAAMQAMIQLANDQANQILYNSAMGYRYRVVAMVSAGAGFVEPTTTPFNTLLNWLTTANDGNLDQAQTLRAQYGADEVLLVNAASEYCGLAWVNTGYNPGYAYANYNGGCLNGRVWAHELGHNFGCYHDRFSDVPTSDANPTYLGFGHCWEDTSKTDCTCYSSVMTYQCNTPTKHCTSCVSKNYMANYLVTESGSATGTATASCGRLADLNKQYPQAYFTTTQPGGMIQLVKPNFAIGISCSLVNISGWMISTTGNDIVSVTLAGRSATIVSQTKNYVMVLSSTNYAPTGVLGDVVVTTSSGRVTTLKKSFSYVASAYDDFENFKTPSLPAGIWSNAGTIPWSFTTENGQTVLYKDGSLGIDESYYVNLQWSSSNNFIASQGGCASTASRIKFAYKAYSSFTFCYDKYQLRIQQNYNQTWKVVWNGVTGATGANPWQYADITLPSQTTGISIYVNTAINTNCRYQSSGAFSQFFFCFLILNVFSLFFHS